MENPNKKIYRLVDLVERLDRNKTTLLRWETEGKIPKARRDNRGWRYYTPEDFALVSKIIEERFYFRPENTSGGYRSPPPPQAIVARERATQPILLKTAARPGVASWFSRFWSLFLWGGLILLWPFSGLLAFWDPPVVLEYQKRIEFEIRQPRFEIRGVALGASREPVRDAAMGNILHTFRTARPVVHRISSRPNPAFRSRAAPGFTFKPHALWQKLELISRGQQHFVLPIRSEEPPAASGPIRDPVLAEALRIRARAVAVFAARLDHDPAEGFSAVTSRAPERRAAGGSSRPTPTVSSITSPIATAPEQDFMLRFWLGDSAFEELSRGYEFAQGTVTFRPHESRAFTPGTDPVLAAMLKSIARAPVGFGSAISEAVSSGLADATDAFVSLSGTFSRSYTALGDFLIEGDMPRLADGLGLWGGASFESQANAVQAIKSFFRDLWGRSIAPLLPPVTPETPEQPKRATPTPLEPLAVPGPAAPAPPKAATPRPAGGEVTSPPSQPLVERQVVREVIREVPAPERGRAELSGIESRLSKAITDIANLFTLMDSKSGYVAAARSNAINRLENVSFIAGTNAFNLRASDIPGLDYLAIGGGTLTGPLIGTSLTLSGDLTVSGTQTLSGRLTIPSFAATSTTATSTIAYGLTVGDQGGMLGIGTTSPQARLAVAGLGSNASRYIFLASDSASTTRFAITESGLVGIGTTTPSEQLALSGRLYVGGSATSTFENNLHVRGNLQVGAGTSLLTGTTLGIGTSSPTVALGLVGSGYLTGGLGVGFATTAAGQLHVTGAATFENEILALGKIVNTSSGTSTFSGGLSTAGLASSAGLRISAGDVVFAGGLQSAGVLNITGSGSSLLSGSLGIGTSSPGTTLGVTGPGVFTGHLMATQFIATSTTATSSIAGGLTVATGGGSVGIGTSSPAEFFSVAGDAIFGGSATSTFQGNLHVWGNFISGKGSLTFGENTIISSGALGLAAGGANALNISTNGQERVRVDSAGLVGIGTSSPGAQLAVAQDGLFGGTLTATRFNATSSLASVFPVASTTSFSVANVLTVAGAGTSTYTGGISAAGLASSAGLTLTGGDILASNISVKAGTSTLNSVFAALGGPEAPSYSFSGDANTGLYSPTADTFAVTTGGAERVRVDSSGNVGIGTTSPGVLLSVNGQGLFQSTTTFMGGILGPSISATGTLGFYTGGAANPRLVIDTNGNVGIGTSSPGNALSVVGNAQITGSINVANCTGCGLNAGTINDGAANRLAFYPSSGTTLDDAARLFWNDTGAHLGIGTTTPLTYAVATVEATSTGAVPLIVRGLTGQTGDLFRIIVPEGGGGVAAATTTLLTVSAGGNLGLGTTTPGATLAVSGDGLIEGTLTASRFQATSSLASVFPVASTTSFSVGNVLTVAGAGTSTYTGGLSAAGLASSAGLRISSGDAVFAGGIQAAGSLNITSSATSTYTGGLSAAGFSTSNGLAVTSGTLNASGIGVLAGTLGVGTTSPGSSLAVSGEGLFAGTVAATRFNATSSIASVFPVASTTSFSVGNVLTVSGAGTSTFSGGISGTSLGLSSGLTLTGGDVLGSNISAKLGTSTFNSLLAALGGPAAPSYTFSGDLDTGIYSPGANLLAISTGGAERVRVDSSGQVGIATTSPTTTFSVTGSGYLTAGLGVGFATTGTGQLHVTGNATFDSEILARSKLVSTDTGTSTFSGGISAAGLASSAGLRVSAGDAVFAGGLQSAGVLNITGSATSTYSGGISSAGLASSAGLTLTGGDILASNISVKAGTSTLNSVFAALGGPGAPSYAFSGDANTGLYSPTADTFAVTTGGSERVRVDSSGQVGIATTSPTTTFSVTGSGYLTAGLGVGFATTGAGQLHVTGAATFENEILALGKIVNTSSGTSTFSGGISAAGLASSNGFRVSAGDATFAGGITVASCAGCGLGAGTINDGAANRLAFYPSSGTTLDDAARLFWNDTGSHLGIGTTTPLTYAVATVEATSTGAVPLIVRGLTGQTGDLFRIIVPEGGGGVAAATTTLLTVSAGGNLGLGTTTPGATLAVSGDGLIEGTLTASRFQATSSLASVFPVASTTSFSVGNVLTVAGAGTSTYTGGLSAAGLASSAGLRVSAGDVVLAGGLQSAGVLNITGSGSSLLSGSLGIATSSPGTALGVTGAGVFTGHLTATQLIATSTTATSTFAGGLTIATGGGAVGIGTSTPGANILSVAGNAYITGTLRANKVTSNTLDPVYNISGTYYATYVTSLAGGVKEETVGTITLTKTKSGKARAVIDFRKAEEGSDLWIFRRITDFGDQWQHLTVLLSPSSSGLVWYEKSPEHNRIVVWGSQAGEVSYRLTANRFDWSAWSNLAGDNDPALKPPDYVDTSTPADDTELDAAELDGEILPEEREPWTVDQATGKLTTTYGLDLSGNDIVNVRSILSQNGSWSISEDGTLVVQNLEVKGSAKFGIPERPRGITLYDFSTGQPYCVIIQDGVMRHIPGECTFESAISATGGDSTPPGAGEVPATPAGAPPVPNEASQNPSTQAVAPAGETTATTTPGTAAPVPSTDGQATQPSSEPAPTPATQTPTATSTPPNQVESSDAGQAATAPAPVTEPVPAAEPAPASQPTATSGTSTATAAL